MARTARTPRAIEAGGEVFDTLPALRARVKVKALLLMKCEQ